MLFKDVSNSYNGKMLESIIKIDDDHIAETRLYYSDEVVHEKNSYGVSIPRYTGRNLIKLNVTKLKKGKYAYSGGMGKSIVIGEPQKTKNIKALNIEAGKLTDEYIIAIANGQSTEASKIVG